MASVSVRRALEIVSRNYSVNREITIDRPVYELVGQALFDIANNPDPKVPGAMTRASRAQRLILNRMVGTRRPGTHPAARATSELEFADLTEAVLE